jgi:hypothetical protein
VRRTGQILREEGCRLHVRATITAASLDRQAAIAAYLCREFKPEQIRFETVYLGGRAVANPLLDSEQAGAFSTHMLEARAVAQSYGVPLLISGSRPGTIHGPYCNVFRQVLNLVPGDLARGSVATACFKTVDAAQASARGAIIGARDQQSGCFRVNHAHVEALRQRLSFSWPKCTDCFNRYHCVGECPDHCPLDSTYGQPEADEPGYRCTVQRLITTAILKETAETLWSESLTGKARAPHGTAIR